MKAVVVGLGASGRAAAAVLKRMGADRIVGVDLRSEVEPIDGVELQLGPHDRETFLAADLIVVSPGVPSSQPDLVAAREHGIEVIGEVGFADRMVLRPECPRIAITGTNGKSTVTHFIGQLLESAGVDVFVGGNLGNPASNVKGESHYVLELSSYQLESAGAFRADVGLILNLSPDHLARHGDMAGYADAKCRLFHNARPSDLCAIPVGDEWLTDRRAGSTGTRMWLGGAPGVVRRGRRVEVELPGRSACFSLDGFGVPGLHNLDNAATAIFAAYAVLPDADRIQAAITGLSALAHRMQRVPSADGRVWIDDSKATNIASTLAALRGRTEPTVLLLGGQWKGGGFSALAPHLGAVSAVICFGANGPDIAAELRLAGVEPREAEGLSEAVALARDSAGPADQILLSPGCASFDEFTDFEHRGRVFAQLAGED